jgi:hypothetical protein
VIHRFIDHRDLKNHDVSSDSAIVEYLNQLGVFVMLSGNGMFIDAIILIVKKGCV